MVSRANKSRSRRRKKPWSIRCAALLAVSLTHMVQWCAGACETSDYKHIVGGQKSALTGLMVAPNSQSDLLIAGSYVETSDAETFLFVYLF